MYLRNLKIIFILVSYIDNNGQVILAGDPKQLGPVVKSPQAKMLGLHRSMIQRFIENVHLYKKDSNGNYNEKFVVLLTKNYRSHPELIKVSNELFYDNKLEACASYLMRNELCNLNFLPQPGFPMIFHSTYGEHVRPLGSTSLYNLAEVNVALEYVKKLLTFVSEGDIGIVTPYKRQEKEIRRVST